MQSATEDIISRLRSFNSTAYMSLKMMDIPQGVLPNPLLISFLKAKYPKRIENTWADSDAVLALVRSLSFCYKPSARINFEEIVAICESLPIEESTKERTRWAVHSFNKYMCFPSGILVNGENPTHLDIIKVFVYSGLADTDEDSMRSRYEEWMKSPFAPMMQWSFQEIAYQIFGLIQLLYNLNERAIRLLEADAAACYLLTRVSSDSRH